MSILSFAFYVVVAYVIYYILIISYDLLTSKSIKGLEGDGSVQYDFGNASAPKVAKISDADEEQSGRKISIESSSERLSEDVQQQINLSPSIDLNLENHGEAARKR